MAEKQNIVVAPLATVTLEDGSVHYLTRGAPLPSSTTKAQVKHLISVGVVEAVEVLTVDNVADAVAIESTERGIVEPPAGDVVIPEGDPTIDWSVKELGAWAEREKVDIPKSAKTKPDILDAIASAKSGS